MPPIYTEPSIGLKDLSVYVNFIKSGSLTLPAYVSFNSGVNTYLPASVNFLLKKDVTAYVNFVNHNINVDVPAYVNFTRHDVSLPAYVNFVIVTNLDLPGSVNFPYYVSLPASTTFIQSDELSLPASVTFKQIVNFPASVNFRLPGQVDLPAYVFMGSFNKDLAGSVIFNQFATKDFRAVIQINQVDVQKTTIETPAVLDFPASVSFKALNTVDLPAVVSFTQFGAGSFNATIQISNKAAGAGGIGIISQPGNGSGTGSNNSSTAPVISPPTVNSNTIAATSDSTGYFVINNLAPGDYTIIPSYPGLNFTPAAFEVTITNSNVVLNFNASGDLVNQVATSSTLPTPTGMMCLIDTNAPGQPGTYSIEGYISLQFASDNYQSVIVVITEEDSASEFRNTIDSKYDLEQ